MWWPFKIIAKEDELISDIYKRDRSVEIIEKGVERSKVLNVILSPILLNNFNFEWHWLFSIIIFEEWSVINLIFMCFILFRSFYK